MANLFELLGLTGPERYSIAEVERAWRDHQVECENARRPVHQAVQDAYDFLTTDSDDAAALLSAIFGREYDSEEPSNLYLHAVLVKFGLERKPVTLQNNQASTVFIKHARAAGFKVAVHEQNPYLFLATEGYLPPDFVPIEQAGLSLKMGKPRTGHQQSEASTGGRSLSPDSYLEHLHAFLKTTIFWTWLRGYYERPSEIVPLVTKVLLVGCVLSFIWFGWETWIARSDVWEDRWVSDTINYGADNAEEVLRVVRTRFSDIERQGFEVFGWRNWWEEDPPLDIADALYRGDKRKRELFLDIRSQTALIHSEIDQLTPTLDRIADAARRTSSHTGFYRANRVWDESKLVMQQLADVRENLSEYASL